MKGIDRQTEQLTEGSLRQQTQNTLTASPKSAGKQAKGLVQAPFYFTGLHYGLE